MLDELVNLSFDLDYTIMQSVNLGKLKNFTKELEFPQIRSDNLFMEYESFITKTKTAFNDLMGILTLCDEQRKVN
jgi:hypothetical protein